MYVFVHFVMSVTEKVKTKLKAEDICLEENGMCTVSQLRRKNNDVAVRAQADLNEYSLFILNVLSLSGL